MLMGCIGIMADPVMLETLKEKFEALQPLMSERLRRYWAATEAKALGSGGMAAVTQATGLSRTTIARGLAELAAPETRSISSPMHSRRPGGGRLPLVETDPTVIQALETLVEPTSRGDPMSPLRWTCKRPRKLAEALQRQGPRVGARTVARLLHALDYRLQANRQTREGSSHPDRNAPFEDINEQVRAFQERSQPVVSIDAKTKELVGDFANQGQAWQPQGTPDEVGTHEFPDPHLGKAIPYGVYEMTTHHGWVSGGLDPDTAQFATATLRRWWQAMGSQL
jgi:DNA-binding phage protein